MNNFEERINLNFPLEVLSKEVCKEYDLGTFVDNKLIEIGYEDYNYILTTSKGKFVVKVFSNLRTDEDCQNLADRGSVPHKYGFSCPEIYEANGKNLLVTTLNNVKFRLLVMEYIRGWELVQVYLLKTNTKAEDMKLQKEEVEQVKWLKYDDFVKLFYSDEFCNHEKSYKDWVCKILKTEKRSLTSERN